MYKLINTKYFDTSALSCLLFLDKAVVARQQKVTKSLFQDTDKCKYKFSP